MFDKPFDNTIKVDSEYNNKIIKIIKLYENYLMNWKIKKKKID